jgi:hypothetical protein
MNQTGWNVPYFTIHPGVNPPPQNAYRLKSVFFFFFQSTGFTSSAFPIQPVFSQNQPAAITLNTGSPRTLVWDIRQLFFKAINVAFLLHPSPKSREHQHLSFKKKRPQTYIFHWRRNVHKPTEVLCHKMYPSFCLSKVDCGKGLHGKKCHLTLHTR